LQQDLAEPMLKILSNNADAHFDLLKLRHSIEGDYAYNIALVEGNDISREVLMSQHSAIYHAIIHRQPSTTK